MSLPHFLGIGAARSGTTWLAEQLQRHPDIWIPRRKELHYFTRASEYASPSYLRDASWVQRLFGRHSDFKKYRSNLVRALGRNVIHPNISQLKWDIKYYFKKPSDGWYASLFQNQGNKITGEITPAYGLLNDQDASTITQRNPDIKVLYIMRNPIERAWSTIRYHEKRYGAKLTEMPVTEIKSYLSNPAILERSDYCKVLQRWHKLLPESQVFIAYYDEIVENPSALVDRLYRFLNVDPSLAPKIESRRQINASFDKDLPEEIKQFLVSQYQDGIEKLKEIDPGGYSGRWSSCIG